MMYRSRKLLDLMAGDSKLAMRHGVLMPCQRCRRWLPTCGAHSNSSRHGKGTGIKSHDVFAAALCLECHTMIDNGKLPREESAQDWFKSHCSTFVWLADTKTIEVPLLMNGQRALPGTVDSSEWLRLWTSGEAGITV